MFICTFLPQPHSWLQTLEWGKVEEGDWRLGRSHFQTSFLLGQSSFPCREKTTGPGKGLGDLVVTADAAWL